MIKFIKSLFKKKVKPSNILDPKEFLHCLPSNDTLKSLYISAISAEKRLEVKSGR